MAPKRARAASVKKGAEDVAAAVEEAVKPQAHGFEFGGPYAHLTKPFTRPTDLLAALAQPS